MKNGIACSPQNILGMGGGLNASLEALARDGGRAGGKAAKAVRVRECVCMLVKHTSENLAFYRNSGAQMTETDF